MGTLELFKTFVLAVYFSSVQGSHQFGYSGGNGGLDPYSGGNGGFDRRNDGTFLSAPIVVDITYADMQVTIMLSVSDFVRCAAFYPLPTTPINAADVYRRTSDTHSQVEQVEAGVDRTFSISNLRGGAQYYVFCASQNGVLSSSTLVTAAPPTKPPLEQAFVGSPSVTQVTDYEISVEIAFSADDFVRCAAFYPLPAAPLAATDVYHPKSNTHSKLKEVQAGVTESFLISSLTTDFVYNVYCATQDVLSPVTTHFTDPTQPGRTSQPTPAPQPNSFEYIAETTAYSLCADASHNKVIYTGVPCGPEEQSILWMKAQNLNPRSGLSVEECTWYREDYTDPKDEVWLSAVLGTSCGDVPLIVPDLPPTTSTPGVTTCKDSSDCFQTQFCHSPYAGAVPRCLERSETGEGCATLAAVSKENVQECMLGLQCINNVCQATFCSDMYSCTDCLETTESDGNPCAWDGTRCMKEAWCGSSCAYQLLQCRSEFITCPVGYTWTTAGRYCIGNNLYDCNQPGGMAVLSQICQDKCVSQAGDDFCASESRPWCSGVGLNTCFDCTSKSGCMWATVGGVGQCQATCNGEVCTEAPFQCRAGSSGWQPCEQQTNCGSCTSQNGCLWSQHYRKCTTSCFGDGSCLGLPAHCTNPQLALVVEPSFQPNTVGQKCYSESNCPPQQYCPLSGSGPYFCQPIKDQNRQCSHSNECAAGYWCNIGSRTCQPDSCARSLSCGDCLNTGCYWSLGVCGQSCEGGKCIKSKDFCPNEFARCDVWETCHDCASRGCSWSQNQCSDQCSPFGGFCAAREASCRGLPYTAKQLACVPSLSCGECVKRECSWNAAFGCSDVCDTGACAVTQAQCVATQPSVCKSRCPQEYLPVCVDGITFNSPCLAQCAGVSNSLPGKCCSQQSDCPASTVCDGRFCTGSRSYMSSKETPGALPNYAYQPYALPYYQPPEVHPYDNSLPGQSNQPSHNSYYQQQQTYQNPYDQVQQTYQNPYDQVQQIYRNPYGQPTQASKNPYGHPKTQTHPQFAPQLWRSQLQENEDSEDNEDSGTQVSSWYTYVREFVND